jgi:cell division protein FtsW
MVADYGLLAAAFALLGLGLVMVYSTTGILGQERFNDSLFFAKRQAISAAIGVLCAAVLLYSPPRLIFRLSPWAYPLTLLLLLLPMIPGVGDHAGGATRWVSLGGFRFQPGELAKLTTVIFIAGYLARQEQRLSGFLSGIVVPLAMLLPILCLYLLNPDFGSTVVLSLIVLAMIACAGAPLRYLAGVGGIAVLAASALVLTSPYRLARIVSFLSPWEDPKGSGYQLIQSLIAVGSGEVSGVGIGASQQKLFFLPAAHTDFIFAVIGEELGFLGTVFVVLLFLVILWRGLVIASRMAEEVFLFSLALGLTLLLVLPAFLNVGIAIGLLPTKGMVLPLVAYGGSSLIASLSALGLLLGVGRHFRRSRS